MKNASWIVAVCVVLLARPAAAWNESAMCALPEAPAEAAENAPSASLCLWQPPLSALNGSFVPNCSHPEGDGRVIARLNAAQHAMDTARSLLADDQHRQALLHLRVVGAAMPEIIDYIAMLEAQTQETLGEYALAAERYYEAVRRSPNADVRALARVGRARNLLAAQDARADAVVFDVLRRYPELPEGPALRLALGELREAQKRIPSAISFYRSLDLNQPGYPVAEKARAHLDALRERKVWIAPYTSLQKVDRAERLVKSGPVGLSREAVAELMAKPLPAELQKRAKELAAKLATVEGRFKDARALSKQAKVAPAEPTPIENEKTARLRVRNLLRGRKLQKVIAVHLVAALEISARANVTDLSDQLLAELTSRGQRVPAKVRFRALYTAAGGATDAHLVALADTLVADRKYGVAARYHRARALERQGQYPAAALELELVKQADTSSTRFYANWADQRLREMERAKRPDICDRSDAPLLRCVPVRPTIAMQPSAMGPDTATALARLKPLAMQHSDGYPWLQRATSLLELGMPVEAADELHETYLAWRSVARRAPLRAGTEAVYRGEGVGRVTNDWTVRRDRLALHAKDRQKLAGVCSALGDWGTAVLFGGRRWADNLPRPFHSEVERAAERHQIDPDLLYAVMRVESVYNRRIISYAGAVGLMQIMPRTGRLIAQAQGIQHLTTTDLLTPAVNIDFAAWYLSSLLNRMGGHLPLAVASYNGGPHNVRKWMHRFGRHIPLDAFLERIPFTQTRRYVRRVLGYYTQYRAQRGERLALMDLDLPEDKADVVAF